MTTFTVGDTASLLAGDVEANLTGAEWVRLNVRRPDGTTLTRDLTVVSPTAGTWSLPAWEAGDLNEEGWYELEVRVKFADGSGQTFWADPDRETPVKIWVRDPIA